MSSFSIHTGVVRVFIINACLGAFVDARKVWVFRNRSSLEPQSSQNSQYEDKTVLAQMKDIADTWGPIYTIPYETGRVEYYGVSKGIIYRVSTKKSSLLKTFITSTNFDVA